jgi:hypothetical protein
MLNYSPPKAKLWGHQVSRHTATEVLTLCQQFVKQYCNILPPPPFKVEPDRLHLISQLTPEQTAPLVAELQQLLGNPVEANSHSLGGLTMHMQSWHYQEAQLPAIAAFYDRHAAVFKKRKVNLTAAGTWFFTWRDDSSAEPVGGNLACYITSPLTVGTHFAFRDFKHYEEIKQHFQQVGLLEMSEKHLTPKALMKEYLAGKK